MLEVQTPAGDDGATESAVKPKEAADTIVRMKIHETKPLFVEDAVE